MKCARRSHATLSHSAFYGHLLRCQPPRRREASRWENQAYTGVALIIAGPTFALAVVALGRAL